jgi:hypothetical protein
MVLRKLLIPTPAFITAHRLSARDHADLRAVSENSRPTSNAWKRRQLYVHSDLNCSGALRVPTGRHRPALQQNAHELLSACNACPGVKSGHGRQDRTFRTKLECSLFSMRSGLRFIALFPIQISTLRRGLVFGVRRLAAAFFGTPASWQKSKRELAPALQKTSAG